MNNVDTRQVDRDSLFLLARLRVDGDETVHRVKMRNLSAGGMMAEGDVKVMRGSRVAVELRNIGWVDGSVAWKQDSRFGIAFMDEIDPKQVRALSGGGDEDEFTSPPYTKNVAPAAAPDPSRLRKI